MGQRWLLEYHKLIHIINLISQCCKVHVDPVHLQGLVRHQLENLLHLLVAVEDLVFHVFELLMLDIVQLGLNCRHEDVVVLHLLVDGRELVLRSVEELGALSA